MDFIPSPFTIEIDGKPIAKIDENAKDGTQARLGEDAAVFSLQSSRLRSGEWIIGRSLTENRSYGPKKVSWYKANAENENQVQPVMAKKEGEAYQLTFTKGMLMVDDDDMVLVNLLGPAHSTAEEPSKVKVILQEG
ncbi:hypothetical protein BKA66DRAFT_430500 [Pyrenochaeta sp. MPI-SDFR-AT-0127]|nr:hypothetical protein BKA66DRAFT_430500 [Pyrenochaeta sp. MPI-SDFR-AT-0127]